MQLPRKVNLTESERDRVLVQLARVQITLTMVAADVRKLHLSRVRHRWMAFFYPSFNDDPHIQLKIHLWACFFWVAEIVSVTVLFLIAFIPHPSVLLMIIFLMAVMQGYTNLMADAGVVLNTVHVIEAEETQPDA